MVNKNGRSVRDHVALPDNIQRERMIEAQQAMARHQAVGAFRGTVTNVAAQIASGAIQALGVTHMDDNDLNAFADSCLALARRIVVKSHGVPFPTGEELAAVSGENVDKDPEGAEERAAGQEV